MMDPSFTPLVVHSTRSWTPPPSNTNRSPQRYYRHREHSLKPSSASKAYLTPTSPLFNRYPPSFLADESAKRSTTPNHHHRSMTPRSMSPPATHGLHRLTRQQSPTPQKQVPSTSLWDQAAEPSVDETNAANLLMGLWYAR